MKWKFKNVVVVVRRRTTYITCPPRRCGVLHKTREGGLSRKNPSAGVLSVRSVAQLCLS